MGKILKVDFNNYDDSNSGYILSKDGKNSVVTGIYSSKLAACVDGNDCYVGTRDENEIVDSTFLSKDDMNKFCLMWLLIFNPDVIKDE